MKIDLDKYPLVRDDFKKWWLDYKKSNRVPLHVDLWGLEFQGFEKLPFSMQEGIWMEYLNTHDIRACIDSDAHVNVIRWRGWLNEMLQRRNIESREKAINYIINRGLNKLEKHLKATK